MLSDAMEDYLKAIYILQSRDGPPVSTSAIAEYLDVSPPTVTNTLAKLDDRGLVDYEKYAGAELTTEGETVALEVLRHHRLIEAYLSEHLDYDWAEVHDEADTLEHHISEEFEQRIAAVLGDPEVDPHGDPIPGADLEPVDDDTTPLVDFDVGDVVEVARVADSGDEVLSYLSNAGITPGTRLEIREVAPFGMVTVAHVDDEQSLPAEVAVSIRVRPAISDAAAPEDAEP